MDNEKILQQIEDYKRVANAIEFIEGNFKSQPTLEEIAKYVHLSKYNFEKLFKRWAGISPMRFVQFLTLEYTKGKLAESKSIFDSAVDAGLSGSNRHHDLFLTFESMSPGEFKKRAGGLEISYCISSSPFGDCFIAVTKRRICYLGFVDGSNKEKVLNEFFKMWPGASFSEDKIKASSLVKKIFTSGQNRNSKPINLLVKGTNFQINVWKALLKIPQGQLVCYQDVAEYLGKPHAVRAVAGAISINPVGYLIPCHRVICKSGKIHKYRYGSTRKKAIIGWEAARF